MSDDDYSYENLKRCNYLDCILKEATRYYGPANGVFYRVATEDTYLKDVPIKKGVLIGVQTLAFHYSE
jgi:cytochrome P450